MTVVSHLLISIQYTIAPALTGAVLLVLWCKSSDYFLERGIHFAISAAVSLVGYVILMTIDTTNTSILYFAMFFCTIGVRKRPSHD